MLSLLTWLHSPFGNWTRKPRPACGFAPPTTDVRWTKQRVRSCAPLCPPPLGPTETWPRRFAAGLRRLAESRSPYRSATPCARPQDSRSDPPRYECAVGTHEAETFRPSRGMDRPTTAGRPLYDRDHGGANFLRNRTARQR